jgi:hypothetical protein
MTRSECNNLVTVSQFIIKAELDDFDKVRIFSNKDIDNDILRVGGYNEYKNPSPLLILYNYFTKKVKDEKDLKRIKDECGFRELMFVEKAYYILERNFFKINNQIQKQNKKQNKNIELKKLKVKVKDYGFSDVAKKFSKRDPQLDKLSNKVNELMRKKYNLTTSGLDLSKYMDCLQGEYILSNPKTIGVSFSFKDFNSNQLTKYLLNMIYCLPTKKEIMKEIDRYSKEVSMGVKDKTLNKIEELISITCNKLNSYEKEVERLEKDFNKIKRPEYSRINMSNKKVDNPEYRIWQDLEIDINRIKKIVLNIGLFCDKVMKYYTELFV